MWIAEFRFKDWSTGDYFTSTKEFMDYMDFYRYWKMVDGEGELMSVEHHEPDWSIEDEPITI